MKSDIKIIFKDKKTDFLVYEAKINEEISQLYCGEVTVITRRKSSPNDFADEFLGKECSLKIQWEQDGHGVCRYFNGIITALKHLGRFQVSPQWQDSGEDKFCSHIQLKIEPQLSLLCYTRRSCDYSNTTPLKTIKKVLERHNISPVIDGKYISEEKYSGQIRFIQNGESDFEFISRIMARYGISYFFAHGTAENNRIGETKVYLSEGKVFPPGSDVEFSGFQEPGLTRLKTAKQNMMFCFDRNKFDLDGGLWKLDEFTAENSIGVEQIVAGTFLPGESRTLFSAQGENSMRKIEVFDLSGGYSKNCEEKVLHEELQQRVEAWGCALNRSSQNWQGRMVVPLSIPGAILQISSFYSESDSDKLPVRVISNELVFHKDQQDETNTALSGKFNAMDFSERYPEKRFCSEPVELCGQNQVHEAVVCDHNGKTDCEESIGHIVPSPNSSPEMPYVFMVRNELGGEGENHIIDVAITMPLGGKNSGLYRFPRVGDRVVVRFDTDRAYLAGYVPDSSAAFSEFTDTGDKYARGGMLMRYTNTEDKESGHPNELGFSHFKSAEDFLEQKIIDGSAFNWLCAEAYLRNDLVSLTTLENVDYAKLTKLRSSYFAKPDKENLEKIRTVASELVKRFNLGNHPACSGDVLQMFSNGVIMQHSEKGIDISCSETINISAKHININGEESLNLQSEGVVRMASNGSMVAVNPNGVAVRSLKLVDSATPFDSAIYINSESGVTVSGSKIKINSLFSTRLSDAFGASVNVAGAVTQLCGALVDVATTAKDELVSAIENADENSGLNKINATIEAWQGGNTVKGDLKRSIADHSIVAGSAVTPPNALVEPPLGNYRSTAAGVVTGALNMQLLFDNVNYTLDASNSVNNQHFLSQRLGDEPTKPTITVRELIHARSFADQMDTHLSSVQSTVGAVQDENSSSVSLFGHLLTLNCAQINDLSKEKITDSADGAGKK